MEKLGIGDWSIPREEYDFTTGFVPVDVIKPHLAESYEQPDPFTTIFHIRKGVHWQNRAPVNGREMDAYDVEATFRRVLGFGDWEEQGESPFAHLVTSSPIISVTATDKWTVEFKASEFSFVTLDGIYFESWEGAWIAPRELTQPGSDHRDWKVLVGTGPFMVTDHVEGTSWTYSSNPNYWFTDDRHPGMRLPYVDEFRMLYITDEATRNAALRSGKIDLQGGYTYEKAQPIEQSNPELIMVRFPGGSFNQDSAMLVTKPPFDQLKVRQALGKGIKPTDIIDKGMVAGLDVVGEQFGAGEMFLPEMMISAIAAREGFAIATEGMEKGQHRPKATMVGMKGVVNALTEAGLRNTVKVIVGGCPVSQEFASEIGADYYSRDAGSTAVLLEESLAKIRG